MVVRFLGKMGGSMKRNWRKLVLGCGVAGLAGLAFCWGRSSAQTPNTPAPAGAGTMAIHKPGEMLPGAPMAPDKGSDYSRRVVAYIHRNIPITREDLGEYLIARYGVDKVEALVNRKIVDHACAARGIHITDAEVESAFADDLRSLKFQTSKDFEDKILKPRHTTIYQWKEDVVRPKLALAQFVRDRIKITEEDLQKAFQNRYGPKVACRMILVPPDQARGGLSLKLWEQVRKSDAEFDKVARTQAIAALAARGGEVPPICRYCGDDKIEKEAFGLNPGDISKLIGTPDGDVILKCVRHVPAERTTMTESDRAALQKDIMDRKVLEEIPKVLKDLRDRAEPKYYIRRETTEEMYRDVARETGLPAPGEMPGPTR
jgi:hypothetical protein